jgi:polyvinyl alcohol dehydrogenase (cytochrome)
MRSNLLPLLLLLPAAFAQDGAALYKANCAPCHEVAATRAPSRKVLAEMSPERILLALESGSMAFFGVARSGSERRTLAEFLSGKSFGRDSGHKLAASAMCSTPAKPLRGLSAGPAWNGWGADVVNSRSQSAAAAGLAPDEASRLKLKWAFGFPGDSTAYAQPAVVDGRVFVGSAGGVIYSLDAATGCAYWSYNAESGVRNAISVGVTSNGRVAVHFGDLHANVYALDANNGELLWKKKVENHSEARITGAPKLHAGRLYVPVSSFEEGSGADPRYECCKFRGSVVALDAASGRQIWKSYTIAQEPRPVSRNKIGTQLWGPSGAAVWSSPTIDEKRHAVYVATGDSYSDPPAATADSFLAFDMNSGKLLWSRQITKGDAFNVACGLTPDPTNCPASKGPDFDFGSSPILVSLAGGHRALVAGQKSGVVHAVDPDQSGKILWQTRVGRGGFLGGVQWGSAADAANIYVAVSDYTVVPGSAEAGAMRADPKTGGGLFALRLTDGKQLWHAPPADCGDRAPCSPAQSAAITVIPGAVFSGALDGHIRGYSAADGKVLWDLDAVREFQTVNGVPARGGAFDGPGPVVVSGMLYTNSGYGWTGSLAGNVLLAFSVDGK